MTFSKKLLSFGFLITKIFGRLIDTVICIIRVMIESRINKFPLTRGGGMAYVLGTGPSLNSDLGHLLSHLSGAEIFCVNDFYKSNYFNILKPKYYVIADQDYWGESRFKEIISPLIDAIVQANWEISLYLPVTARNSILDREARVMDLKVYFYNKTPLAGSAKVSSLLFKRRMAMPRPQNVLVAAIALAMWSGCKQINILGADHDWHNEIQVSNQNILKTKVRHSYDEQEVFRPFFKPRTGSVDQVPVTFTVAEIFLAWSMIHRSYELLNVLAIKEGVEIYNCGSSSFIDAFNRKNFF